MVCPPLLLTLVCSLGWLPAAAVSQTAPGGSTSFVLVIPPGKTADVPDSVANTIEQHMKSLLGIDSSLSLIFSDVRDPGTDFELPAPPPVESGVVLKPVPDNPKLTQVLASLDKARDLVRKKSWESALTRLMSIKNTLSGMVADTDDLSALIETHELIAVSFINGGFSEEGAAAVKALLAINPGYTGAGQSDRVQAAVERNRDRLGEGGVLVISVEPSDAVVYVDGRLIGQGDQTISGLARGKHYVRVTGETSFPSGGSVTTKAAGQSTMVSYALKTRVEKPKAAPVQASLTKAGPRPLVWYGKSGLYDHQSFSGDVKAEASAVFADHVLFSFYARSNDRFHVGAFIASGLTGAVLAVEPAVINLDLGNMYVELLGLETRIQKAIADPSTASVVTSRPAIYSMVQAKPKPVPAPAPAPAPVPEPAKVETKAPKPASAPVAAVTRDSGIPEDFPMAVPEDFPMGDSQGYAQEDGQQYVTEEVVDQKEEVPVYKQWWLWTVIGLVVAGAAAGTAAGVILSGDGAADVNGGISW